MTILEDQSTTQGHYDLIEGHKLPGDQTPPHRHTRYAELVYVLDGELTVWLGKDQVTLCPGERLTIPVGTAHVVSVIGDGPAHALVIASPSGFASVIAEAGVPDTGGPRPEVTEADLERLHRAATAVGDEILGPPGALPEA